MKKVSLIIPVYNTEKYLKKCIDSVINQTYKNIEIIVINDGSKGKCSAIMSSFKDKRINYYKRTNHGIGATRNFGLDKVSGDYIVFLDSDDYLIPNSIEKMVNKCINNKLDIVVTNYIDYLEDKQEENLCQLISFKDTSLNNKKELINKLNLGPSNKMFSKNLFINNRFPENIKYEDFALMLKLFDQAKLIGKIDEPLFIFNKRNNGETLTVDKKVFDIFVSLDEIINYFNSKYKKELDYFIIKTCLLYATKQKYQKDKKIKYDFINFAYDYINNNIKDYKNNKYFNDCSFLKRTIQKNKLLLKVYCSL